MGTVGWRVEGKKTIAILNEGKHKTNRDGGS